MWLVSRASFNLQAIIGLASKLAKTKIQPPSLSVPLLPGYLLCVQSMLLNVRLRLAIEISPMQVLQ
jgi:hypothetical protein